MHSSDRQATHPFKVEVEKSRASRGRSIRNIVIDGGMAERWMWSSECERTHCCFEVADALIKLSVHRALHGEQPLTVFQNADWTQEADKDPDVDLLLGGLLLTCQHRVIPYLVVHLDGSAIFGLLCLDLLYPTYREGITASVAEERDTAQTMGAE